MPEPRFTYSNEQLLALIQAIQTKTIQLTQRTPETLYIGQDIAYRWALSYPIKVIDDSLSITASWFVKNFDMVTTPRETSFVKYASKVMRNRFEEQEKLQALQTEARLKRLRAEWDAMTPEKHKQWTDGFDGFESMVE